MPLRRGNGEPASTLKGVEFPMWDEGANMSVSCMVTGEGLASVEPGYVGNGLAVFYKHREEIEQAASALYVNASFEPIVVYAADIKRICSEA